MNEKTDLCSRFIEFYHNELHDHPIFQEMYSLAEESPWHREQSIGIHTDMVVAEYLTRCPAEWTTIDVVGAMACAFHDFGKPKSMEVLYREDRGNYKRFTGHEKISARIFEDWAIQNMFTMDYLGLELKHVHMIAWLCEYHLPWGIKKPDKRRNLALTALYIERECSVANPFDMYELEQHAYKANILTRVLLSDTYGRISDDAQTKRDNAHAWCTGFETLKSQVMYDDFHERVSYREEDDRPVLYVAIGAPACGKSTFRKELAGDTLIHNMDELRCEWYLENGQSSDADYDLAYKLSTEDKQFSSKVHQYFIKLIKTGQNIYCDNTNASGKRRRFYVLEAHKHGYKTVAVLFPVPLQTLLDRQKTREDKTVPEVAVKSLWNAISQPQIGEFDEILVID